MRCFAPSAHPVPAKRWRALQALLVMQALPVALAEVAPWHKLAIVLEVGSTSYFLVARLP